MYLEPISRRRRALLLALVVAVSAAMLLSVASVQAAPDALTCRYVWYPCYTRYPRGWGSAQSCQRQVWTCYGVSYRRVGAR